MYHWILKYATKLFKKLKESTGDKPQEANQNIVKESREVNKEVRIQNHQSINQYLHPRLKWRYTIEDAPEMSSQPNFTRVI